MGLGYYLLQNSHTFTDKTNTAKLLCLSSVPNTLQYFMPKTVHCVQDSDPPRVSNRFNFLAEAVEIAAPSVVFIERVVHINTIFGVQHGSSFGSGFVVDDGTFVLTNAHVVGSARSVKVKLPSGEMLTGEVTDLDQVADLALIKLQLPFGKRLPALKFGRSSELRPGEWVVALGSPLALSNTITAGIVSNVQRPSKELNIDHHFPDMEYVQTDAAITKGNSGGPLVNLDGEVIGVNNMSAGPGISFAIPSDVAQNFVTTSTKTVQKRSKSRQENKYAIGVSMLSLTPGVLQAVRHRLHLPSEVTHGVFVANVWAHGAAARAGLRRGDVIVRINGKNIKACKDVHKMVQSGNRLNMEIVRDSHWQTISVVPEAYDPGL